MANVNPSQSTRFKPGHKPYHNSGRPKDEEGLGDLCRFHSIEMVQILYSIARDKKAKKADRIRAIESILDRGYGKPQQEIKSSKQGDTFITVQLSGNEVRETGDLIRFNAEAIGSVPTSNE